jgi:hypothetical protein
MPKNSQFPTIYEDSLCKAYTNGSGEIFVETKQSDIVCIRVTPHQGEITVTAASCQITPWAVQGLPAIRVTSR